MEYLNKTKFDLIEMDWLLHTHKKHTLFSNVSTYKIFMEINYKKGHGKPHKFQKDYCHTDYTI